jgi:hypothetical protein
MNKIYKKAYLKAVQIKSEIKTEFIVVNVFLLFNSLKFYNFL